MKARGEEMKAYAGSNQGVHGALPPSHRCGWAHTRAGGLGPGGLERLQAWEGGLSHQGGNTCFLAHLAIKQDILCLKAPAR